jgi:FAD-dependent urate hydroxylase
VVPRLPSRALWAGGCGAPGVGHQRRVDGVADPAFERPGGTVHVAPIEEVTLDRWSCGSVLLIGDAAHATSPNMAEGAAMALEDGLVLAECLALELGIAQAMARFQARRRPRTQWVLAQTHRRDRTRNLPPALRNLVLRRWGRNIFHTNYRPLLELP